MSYSCNFYFIISLIYRAFAKYRKKSKIHRPFWGDFTVEEVKYILKQPPGNDHCGFYVMHYMHCYTGDCRSAEMVCMKWLIDICSCVLNFLTCLISCCCVIFFPEHWVGFTWIAHGRASSTSRRTSWMACGLRGEARIWVQHNLGVMSRSYRSCQAL